MGDSKLSVEKKDNKGESIISMKESKRKKKKKKKNKLLCCLDGDPTRTQLLTVFFFFFSVVINERFVVYCLPCCVCASSRWNFSRKIKCNFH